MRFWQYYDFSIPADSGDPFGDLVMEAAQVALSTDNGATWNDLYATQAERSADWEEVDVDLGKYAGQVVRFRFNYQLFAFTGTPRMGWLLDDLSVDMTSVPSATVEVTNNLAQAVFSLAGPNDLAIAGQGADFLTNTPPGQYIVTWLPVPFYATPSPQTNILTAAAPLVFHGAYSFPDLNHNGISDLWEQKYFGGIASTPVPNQDTDGDGATDLEEFVAGTDPTDPQSRLLLAGPLMQPNHTVRFEWLGAPGRAYQLEVSNDLLAWQAVADAQRGAGTTLAVTLPALDPRLAYYFRLRVIP